jgi:hypothetical protein
MKTHPHAGSPGASGTSVNPLVFDLLDWLAVQPRPYDEVMEVWRTSCPRLTIWEDAVDLGWVIRRRDIAPEGAMVRLTDEGRLALRAQRAAA